MISIEELRTYLTGEQASYSDEKLIQLRRNAERIVFSVVYWAYSGDDFELDAQYDMDVLDAFKVILAKEGAESQTQHSANGTSRSYEKGDMPYSLLARWSPFAEVQ